MIEKVPKEAARFLDRVVRLLRKKGVGVTLISNKISDFDPAMCYSMNISIVFRTKYDGDLESIQYCTRARTHHSKSHKQ